MTDQEVIEVKIDDILVYRSIDPRIGRDDSYIASMMYNIENLPPITITQDMILVDGNHRIEAHRRANQETITAHVVQVDKSKDTLIDAAYALNADNSMPFTLLEKLKYAQRLYERDVSKKEIAETVRVSRRTVYKWFKKQEDGKRKEYEKTVTSLHESGMSNSAIAKQLGVSRDKIARTLKAALHGKRSQIRQPQPQGETATMSEASEQLDKILAESKRAAREEAERNLTGIPTEQEYHNQHPFASIGELDAVGRKHQIELKMTKLSLAMSHGTRTDIRNALRELAEESTAWDRYVDDTNDSFREAHHRKLYGPDSG